MNTTTTNVTNAADSNPPASLTPMMKQASGTWRNFEDALKSLSEHSWVFSNITEAVDRHRVTELEAQEKNKKIAELESSLQAHLDQYERRCIKWDQEKSQLQQQVEIDQVKLNKDAQMASKKQEASHAQEKERLKKQLDAAEKTIATLQVNLKEAHTKTKKIESDLVRCTGRMKEWEGFVSLLRPVDYKSLDERVGQLITRCHSIVRKHFFRNLPIEFFANGPQWDHQTRSLGVPLSFPPSNTPAARYVRMAASLHLIAGQLCTSIFKPCYIPESADVSEAIKETLTQQNIDNPKKERLTRALLLSTYEPEDIDDAIKQAANSASENVRKILSSIGGNEEFRKEIEKLFLDAAQVWKEAQHSTKMVEASMKDDDFHNWNWGELEEFTSAHAETEPQPALQSIHMLTLFPRVYVRDDKHIISSGFVLWDDAPIVFAAEQELRECILARKSTSGWNGNSSGGSMRRERRLSTLPDRRNEVTASSPTSSRAENKAPFLETQRPQMQGSKILNGTGGKG
ncbi:hypothetical protein MMC11_008219 [Xylographa trunciseda]|nr:hypothetical protein [Xylographa trunciseda]